MKSGASVCASSGFNALKFLELANAAKDSCPISEALSAVKIVLNASLK